MTFEQQFVRQATGGSRQAFDILVEQHYVHVYRFVRRHAANADDAFDLTQNTFVKAYTRMSQLDDPDRFEAWVRQIALNECRMAWRSNGVHELSLEALEQSATSSIESDPGLVTPSVEESVISDEGWRSVLRAIDSLPFLSGLPLHSDPAPVTPVLIRRHAPSTNRMDPSHSSDLQNTSASIGIITYPFKSVIRQSASKDC